MNVLVVDDSEGIRKVVLRIIKASRFKFNLWFEAANGQEALEILSKQEVDLVLADVNMPVMDGLELLKRIRENQATRSIPVVMVTTEAAVSRIEEAQRLGASGYVRKPFTPHAIDSALERVFTE